MVTKNIMKKTKAIIFLVGILTSVSSYSQGLGYIKIHGDKLAYDQVCFDQGYIRAKNSFGANKIPAISKSVLKLSESKVVTTYSVIPAVDTYYDQESRTFKKYKIERCSQNLILDNFVVPEKREVLPAGKAIYYGNLVNNGIDHIVNENWKKYSNINEYIKRQGQNARVELKYGFEDAFERTDWNQYQSWRDISERVGGEQSGGGGSAPIKDARLSVRISAADFVRARKEVSSLERFFKVDNTYTKVLDEGERLPRAKMWVKKLND